METSVWDGLNFLIFFSLFLSVVGVFKGGIRSLIYGVSDTVDMENGYLLPHKDAGIVLLVLSLICCLVGWNWTGTGIDYHDSTRYGSTVCRYVQFQPVANSDSSKFYSLPTEIDHIPGLFGGINIPVRAYWPNGGYLDFESGFAEPPYELEVGKAETVRAQDGTLYTAVLTNEPAEHEKITVSTPRINAAVIICAIVAIQFFLGAIRAFKRARQDD